MVGVRIIVKSVVFFMVLFFAAPSARAARSLTIGHVGGTGGAQDVAAKAFAAEIERLLPGRFTFDLKGGSTLGGEEDVLEAVKLGAVDMAILTSAIVAVSVPQLGILDVPYLFRDSDHAAKVLDGPIGQELGATANDKDIVFLGYIGRGFRQLSNSKRPVASVADVAGLKIRVIARSLFEDAFKAFGTQAVPLSYTELYGALDDGRVDGQDNALMVVTANRFDRVQGFFSLTAHAYSTGIILMHAPALDSLKPEEREAFRAAALVAAAVSRAFIRDSEGSILAGFKQRGIQVTEAVDREGFIAALAPLRQEWEKRFGETLFRRIQETR